MKIADLILEYLHDHPQQLTRVMRGHYQNAVAFTLSDHVIFPYNDAAFPENKLEAICLPDDFERKYPKAVRWIAEIINPDEPPRANELWLSTCHLKQAGRLFVEVSFE